ncbi:MAG: energy-coupling factor ABC transporter ATP-binding protein [Anaerolineales bacterium]
MDNELIFKVTDLCFAYDQKIPALDLVNLAVTSGEGLVILGANGCGKSTLLKILDGLYFPDRGSVLAFGKPLTEAAFLEDAFNFDFRRQVGLVFQDSDVQLFMPSVWDEVAFAPLQLGTSQEEVKDRVASALAALQIEKLRDRPPHQLSNGEKKRVALATVRSLDPEVWLLDEPTSGLDPRSQGWLVEFIISQRQSGKTLVAATHDLAIAEQIATRIIVFDEDHHIAASGDPAEILGDHELLHKCNLSHFHVAANRLDGKAKNKKQKSRP